LALASNFGLESMAPALIDARANAASRTKEPLLLPPVVRLSLLRDHLPGTWVHGSSTAMPLRSSRGIEQTAD